MLYEYVQGKVTSLTYNPFWHVCFHSPKIFLIILLKNSYVCKTLGEDVEIFNAR